MLKGLGLHAEQLQVWALRASEGNLLEDNSKAIGDEVSMLWVCQYAGVCRQLLASPCSCQLKCMLLGTTSATWQAVGQQPRHDAAGRRQ